MIAELLDKHSLPTADFAPNDLEDRIGQRFSVAGLSAVTQELKTLGEARSVFLEQTLSAEQARSVNSAEAIAVAIAAAIFQERVSQVEINDNCQGLDDLRAVTADQGLPWTFSDAPYHQACGEWAGQPRLFLTRHDLTETLSGMGHDLMGAGYGLHFEDGFRPLGVQEGLFRRRYQMAAAEHPEWSHEELLLESRSKTACTPRFASHKGAAAVDIRVRDLETGRLLDIGHNYPDGGAIVALDSPFVTQAQWENRILLAIMAGRRGLSLYPFEDWHVCLGDTTAAACSEEDRLPVARFGPIKAFNMETGEVLAVYGQTELDATFPLEV